MLTQWAKNSEKWGNVLKNSTHFFMSNTYSSFSKSWFLLIDLIQVPMNWIIATSGNSPIIVIMVWAEKNSAEFFFTRPHCIFIYQQLSYIQEVLFELYDFEPQQRFFKKIFKEIWALLFCTISSKIMHIKENSIVAQL